MSINNARKDKEKLKQEIEKVQQEAEEKATKEAEAKAKREMEEKLQEEVEKMRIEEASKTVNKEEIDRTLDNLSKSKDVDELVKKAKETGKTVDELLAQKENTTTILDTVGETVNNILDNVFKFVNNMIGNSEDGKNDTSQEKKGK